MSDQSATGNRRPGKAAAVGLLAAGALAGGILAGTLSASAATTGTTTPSTSASTAPSSTAPTSTSPGTTPAPNGGPHGFDHGGASPVRADEKSVSTTDADAIRAAALKAVPGGSVYRVETDSGDAAYEAHMTKSDGSLVTVKFDKNLNVTGVEDDMGK